MSENQTTSKPSSPSKSIGFLTGLALGASAASVATFLYKTKKGRKIRKELQSHYQLTLKHLKTIVKDVKTKTKELETKIESQSKKAESQSKKTKRRVVFHLKKNLFRRSGQPVK